MTLTIDHANFDKIERGCLKLHGIIDLLSACKKDDLRDDAINLVALALDDILDDLETELKLK